jgi:hypothetical protein
VSEGFDELKVGFTLGGGNTNTTLLYGADTDCYAISDLRLYGLRIVDTTLSTASLNLESIVDLVLSSFAAPSVAIFFA